MAKYSFSRTEACMMWAHVEAEIVLEYGQVGDRVEGTITVSHACDPFGDHQEWVWSERLPLRGTARGGQIVMDDPAVVATLTFDPASIEQDWMWSPDGAQTDRFTPPLDFWAPLFGWGWARQATAWSRPLAADDLARAMTARSSFARVDDMGQSWFADYVNERLRFWDSGTFSAARGYGYRLEHGARCVKRWAEAPAASRRGWVVVFEAFTPARIEELLAKGPPSGADAETRDDWYRFAAGRRPEYVIGWLENAADADAWCSYLNAEIARRLAAQ